MSTTVTPELPDEVNDFEAGGFLNDLDAPANEGFDTRLGEFESEHDCSAELEVAQEPRDPRDYDPGFEPEYYDDSPENLARVAEMMRPGVKHMLRRSNQLPYLDEVMQDVLRHLWESMARWHGLRERPRLVPWATGVYRNAVHSWQKESRPRVFDSKKHTSYDLLTEAGYEPRPELHPTEAPNSTHRDLFHRVRRAVIAQYGVAGWERAYANATHAQRGVNDREFMTEVVKTILETIPQE